jgi:hypothetical protein
MSGFIPLHKLYEIKKNKEKKQVSSYNAIGTICNNKITKVAKHGGTGTFFSVPGLMLGLPLYDLESCIEYLITGLKKHGYFVSRLPHPNFNVIYISWDPKDVKPKYNTISNR